MNPPGEDPGGLPGPGFPPGPEGFQPGASQPGVSPGPDDVNDADRSGCALRTVVLVIVVVVLGCCCAGFGCSLGDDIATILR